MKFTDLFRKKSATELIKHGDDSAEHHSMNKVLRVKDLTFFGIAAVIGAGIFTSIGKACYDGGPGVIFLYVFTALACGFAALGFAIDLTGFAGAFGACLTGAFTTGFTVARADALLASVRKKAMLVCNSSA